MTVWSWRFRSQEELERALEEYASLSDGTKVAKYEPHRPGGEPGEGLARKEVCVLKQNAEIDRRLIILRGRAPLYARIISLFYCRGLCYEEAGWRVTAKACGLPATSTTRDKERFLRLLETAVTELWHSRRDLTPDDGRPYTRSGGEGEVCSPPAPLPRPLCLICLQRPADQEHHWPRTRRYGEATVPVCGVCHEAAHKAHPDALAALVFRAPLFWSQKGTWETVRPAYDAWVGRRRFLEATR